jgi:hypothetical protein
MLSTTCGITNRLIPWQQLDGTFGHPFGLMLLLRMEVSGMTTYDNLLQGGS